jgi:hypothetical protein
MSTRIRRVTKSGSARSHGDGTEVRAWIVGPPPPAPAARPRDRVTPLHARSPEWRAGYEVGLRVGVEEGRRKQTDVVLDVVRSALRIFEQRDDMSDDLVAWIRARLR